MRDGLRLPDLTFPNVQLGEKETPWNLNRWLYKGGAAQRVNEVSDAIRTGRLGQPLPERVELVQKLHEVMSGRLVEGISKRTVLHEIFCINWLFRWAEQNNHPLTAVDIQTTYIHWTDSLNHRVDVLENMKVSTAWSQAAPAGGVLDLVLGRITPMLGLTRIGRRKLGKAPQGVRADKQNLEWTFAFGHLLQDICDGLPLEVLWGPMPLRIALRNGSEIEKAADSNYRGSQQPATCPVDRNIRTRYSLVNLRIQAELLMFIGQTGINLAQAHQLTLHHFSYSSDVDSYKVRDYKARRGGEVLFVIFKEYKAHLERYLAWRRSIFPKETLLFPLVRFGRAVDKAPQFDAVVKICKRAGVRYIGPQMLRGTRVNWLLRRSGDANLTAEMSQHAKQTLIGVYEAPSLQRAVGEISRFWQDADPTLALTIPLPAVAPGSCDGVPTPVPLKPQAVASPDCVRPSGCLWCEHHRDIDSLDYIWALACFRHLKILEVAQYHPPLDERSRHPGEHVVTRISDKLAWFRDSNMLRRSWVEEALDRVDEGFYHPEWGRLISDMEGVAP